MNFRLLPQARDEMREAYDFFEARITGLGRRFSLEVAEAIEKIRATPLTWPNIDNETRKCSTRKFKYGVLYRIEGESIVVVAVMDLRRRPGYWKHRR